MIEIKGLTKQYGDFTALNDLTLTIDEGIVFGLVGANGAGKSTTFSILATLLAPTRGDALINGVSVVDNPMNVRAQLGYMPDFFGVYDQLKTEEYLDFYAASYQIDSSRRKLLITELLSLVKLSDKRHTYVDLLSRGMKQRLCLARALIHDPKVLILDEPASGLDPRARAEMRDILHELKLKGKTILISSHILPELAEMCDEIGVLERGKLIAYGNVASIQAQLQGERILNIHLLSSVQEAATYFHKQPLVTKTELTNDTESMKVYFKGTKQQQVQLLADAFECGLQIYSAEEVKMDLEDIFLTITKGVASDE